MSRLKQAWQALRGTLEPEVREVKVAVIGPASQATVYRVYTDGFDTAGRHERAFFTTCAEAHAAYPLREVKQVAALRIGEDYFFVDEHFTLTKPKRAKGAK